VQRGTARGQGRRGRSAGRQWRQRGREGTGRAQASLRAAFPDPTGELTEEEFGPYINHLLWELPFAELDINSEHWFSSEEIANLAGGIYDKMVTFIQSFEKIEKHLKSASDSYDHARKVLVDGKGNAINRLESLKKLGVSPTKKLSDTSFGNNFSDDAEEVEIINQI
jgi:DNA recombination protein RmuC